MAKASRFIAERNERGDYPTRTAVADEIGG
jgi:hypothetical protein